MLQERTLETRQIALPSLELASENIQTVDYSCLHLFPVNLGGLWIEVVPGTFGHQAIFLVPLPS